MYVLVAFINIIGYDTITRVPYGTPPLEIDQKQGGSSVLNSSDDRHKVQIIIMTLYQQLMVIAEYLTADLDTSVNQPISLPPP